MNQTSFFYCSINKFLRNICSNKNDLYCRGIKNKDYISLEVSMSKSHMYNYNYHFQYEDRTTKEARIRGRSISKHPGI